MKTYLMLAGLMSIACLHEALATGISETNNGFYLVVGAVRSAAVIAKEPIRFDDRLLWLPFSEKGQVELSYPVEAAYRMRIRMTGTNGIELPKTSLGKKFGTKFDNLHSFTDTRPYPFVIEGSYKDNPDLGGGRFLPSPNELFQIKKEGIYTLEIQMQMFYPNPQSTNAWHRDLVRFSPIKIQVEKPKEG